MKLTKEEFAAMITGREYAEEITKAEEALAKQNGLVVLFGASDDLAEFRGAIYEEGNCYDGVSEKNKLPLKWRRFVFPNWVPQSVRQSLRSFWSEKYGRSPLAWHRGTVEDPYNNQPKLGERVTCEGMFGADRQKKFAGRWVPMWNNIGRLVRNNGEVLVMSTGCIIKRKSLSPNRSKKV